MDEFYHLYGRYPEISVCDASYGSEEKTIRFFSPTSFTMNGLFVYIALWDSIVLLCDIKRKTDNSFEETISRYKVVNLGMPAPMQLSSINNGKSCPTQSQIRETQR